jgi:hypothetical protein
VIQVAKRSEVPPRRRGRVAGLVIVAAFAAGTAWWWRAQHPQVVVLDGALLFAPRLRSVEFERSDGYRVRSEWVDADGSLRIRLPIPDNDSEGYALRATRSDGSIVESSIGVTFNRLTVVVLSEADCRCWTIPTP